MIRQVRNRYFCKVASQPNVGAWSCIHTSDSFLNYKGGKEHLERHNKSKLKNAFFQDLASWSQEQHFSDILL